MSYVPKTAQRKINRWINERTIGKPGSPTGLAPSTIPRRLDYGTPGAGCYEVYLDGVRQHLCTVAETCDPATGVGYVTRFIHGKGNQPLTRKTETVLGKVEIKLKGAKHV